MSHHSMTHPTGNLQQIFNHRSLLPCAGSSTPLPPPQISSISHIPIVLHLFLTQPDDRKSPSRKCKYNTNPLMKIKFPLKTAMQNQTFSHDLWLNITMSNSPTLISAETSELQSREKDEDRRLSKSVLLSVACVGPQTVTCQRQGEYRNEEYVFRKLDSNLTVCFVCQIESLKMDLYFVYLYIFSHFIFLVILFIVFYKNVNS